MNAQEQSALRWGGLTGMLGSALLLGVFAFLAAFVGLETREAEAAVRRFPEIRWVRVIENTAYLLTIALWTLHCPALLVALRRTSLAPALAATVMSTLGLAVLALGAVPHTAKTVIADLCHAPETAAGLQSVLLVAWQASQGWVDALVVTGISLTPIGLLLFGVAMSGAPHYGKWMGVVSIALGLIGLCAAGAALLEEGDIFGLGIFALVFFHAIIGWRTFRLSAQSDLEL